METKRNRRGLTAATEQEKRLLAGYRTLDEEQRRYLESTIELLASGRLTAGRPRNVTIIISNSPSASASIIN